MIEEFKPQMKSEDNPDRKTNLRNLFKLDEFPIPDYLYQEGWGKEDVEDFVSYMLEKRAR